MTEALTAASYFVAGVVIYYGLLFCVSFMHRGPDAEDPGITFVIFVPALNEEAVIELTLRNLLAQRHDRYVICVADDGSTDSTASILGRYAGDSRLMVLHRQPPRAQIGKSDVLNACFDATMHALSSNHPVLGGLDPSKVVAVIVDADGRLDEDALQCVAPYFGDPGVASVQIGVRIANAGTNLLTRMQDMEFVGFSAFVQRARDRFGSSGLGGNGQFTRLSALADLAMSRGGPWQLEALTEDLELGLALVCRGWRTRYCPDAYVAQQGLPRWRPLFRQRTRWIQGHYSCWSYLPKLARSSASVSCRIDLGLYLLLIVTVVAVTFCAVVSTLGVLGLGDAHSDFLVFLPLGPWRNSLSLLLGVTPLSVFMYAYQREAAHRFHAWEVPTAAVVFTAYTYVWIFASIRAVFRNLAGRRNWIKTPRVAELPSPGAPLAELPAATEPKLLGSGA